MVPISTKANRVLWVLLVAFAIGMAAFMVFGLLGQWRIGAVIFAVLGGAGSWYYFFEPIKRFDRFHTAEDYRAGKVPGYGHLAKEAPGKVILDKGFASFRDHWRPKVVAELNGQEVKLVKIKGEFPWHQHDDVDEMFLVWRGNILLEFRDRVVPLAAGEALVVPRGVEHRPVAAAEAEVLLFEPAGTRNTGNVQSSEFTAPDGVKLAQEANP